MALSFRSAVPGLCAPADLRLTHQLPSAPLLLLCPRLQGVGKHTSRKVLPLGGRFRQIPALTLEESLKLLGQRICQSGDLECGLGESQSPVSIPP